VDFWFGLAVGVVISLLMGANATVRARGAVARALDGARRRIFAVSPQSIEGAAPPSVPSEHRDAAEPLAERLHQLQSGYAQTIEAAAHPRELEDQRDFQAAAALFKDPNVALDTVLQYATGANWALSCAALEALTTRPDRDRATVELLLAFDHLAPWAMHFAFKSLLAADPRPPIGAAVAKPRDWWIGNNHVLTLFREYFIASERLGDLPAFGGTLDHLSADDHQAIINFLGRINHPSSAALIALVEAHLRSTVDRAFLSSFGRFWEDGKDIETTIEPEVWRDALRSAEAVAREGLSRSLLVSGEHGVGKTSFLRMLSQRLTSDGWSIFEAGGADLMAGQQWFGQLEGRIQRTVKELAARKKLIWYIPDLQQIAMSGTHQGQAASILDQILPAIVSRQLIVWTEARPDATVRLLRLRPALRSAFELVRVDAMSNEETIDLSRHLIDRLAGESDLSVDAAAIDAAMGATRQYLTSASLPGAVLDLLRLTIGRVQRDGGCDVGPSDIVETLSQLTGLPVSILDTKQRVDLASIRAYFSARIIGQEAAVSAVVDRIAMLKAGLNDPGKPIAVFLFAGPTGTGKTELAKTLAEFLFGSVDRMVRLDMSEFQTVESTIKILGGGDTQGESDSLINRVRKQPFSVVLLDEFEKAHSNVWDLFLQVFDDGRLTDSAGHVADFRHCIMILTTNLGATSHRTSGLGFVAAESSFSTEQVMRAIGSAFRPEFQNRIDEVLVFQPLTRDLMRGILKKELDGVLRRRGLTDRAWAVEWEASALEFLLEKGFSPEMGARPLKRAIDRYVIAPLAATIVEKRFPEGDQFVFVRSDGRAIQAEFVDPDEDSLNAAPAASNAVGGTQPPLAVMILSPAGTPIEIAALDLEYRRIDEQIRSPDWTDLAWTLADRMSDPEFWSRSDRYGTLSRVSLMGRVAAAAETAAALQARLAKGVRGGKSSRELISRLAQQIYLVQQGILDVHQDAPIETVLAVEPAFERPGDLASTRDWCAEIHEMYRSWAATRHMQVVEVPAGRAGALPWLTVSGFGAYRLLDEECGLHVLDSTDDESSSNRIAARVRVAAVPLQELPKTKLRAELQDCLNRAGMPSAIVRRYRKGPSPLVRSQSGGWRTGRLNAVMAGNFDLIAALQV
jgi:ATP-dependent Clp protease ATP-binding subunit ClpC